MSATDGIAQVNTIATNTAMSAWAWGGDFLIVIVLVAFLFLFAWYIGRGQLVALLLAFYAGYAVYTVFPYASYLPTAPALTALLAHVGVYLGFSLVAYLILRRVVVSDFLYIGPIGLAILSFLGAGFLLALAYHVFPVHDVYTFTPAIDKLFAAKDFFFWWFGAPLVGLFFLAR